MDSSHNKKQVHSDAKPKVNLPITKKYEDRQILPKKHFSKIQEHRLNSSTVSISDKKRALVIWFHDLRIEDVPIVGGKNASLGEMVANLGAEGVSVPNGFAITAHAYDVFLEKTGLREKIKKALHGLNTRNIKDLAKRGEAVRNLILGADLPEILNKEIAEAYKKMEGMYFKNVDTAVRSSATAEDLPDASFAGQQETYLNISGVPELLVATKKCFASLFTNRAISYREDKGFSHFDISLSVGVQKMVRSDMASSGIAFSIDTETGFDKVVVINSSYGLGELVVQGQVTPDEFTVFKPTLKKGKKAILARDIGTKDIKMIYDGDNKVVIKKTLIKDRERYSLTDTEVLKLADWVTKIEEYYSKKKGHYQPMDTEWAKDGKTGDLFIVQARPETVQATRDKNVYEEYKLKKAGKELVRGTAVGSKIATGKVRVIKDVKNISQFKAGEVLVTEITDPDWEPIMKIASAIVTDKGGRTSHAAIVSRELGITCVVGSETATKILKGGKEVTVDSSSGKTGIVYEGKLPFDITEHRLDNIPKTKTQIMVNIGSPEEAFRLHALPAKGVGLGRLEFIINEHIQIHPKALIEYSKLQKSKDPKIKKIVAKIDELTKGYKNKADYYVDELAEGVAKIGAAFWPNKVIIRFSDFKTNEYRTLIGGELYEPKEENPMIGWRGASRYYHEDFRDAFLLEVKALKKVRDEIGLINVIPMVPFCRTVEEGKKVVEIIENGGLDRKQDPSLKIYMMCEIPSNVLLAREFYEIFDGMSIGSNDLTQLVLGLDRDSSVVSKIGNENNEAVKKLIQAIIKISKIQGKYIGICGQAPSDFPGFAEFLVREGIESISLSPDTVIKTLPKIAEVERSLGSVGNKRK